MKPDWDKLANEFADSQTVLIADVDCTVEKPLCSRFDVKGFPTIKYFTTSTGAGGAKYEGGRDFKALKAFAESSLGPSCGNDNKDLCNEEQLAILAKGNAMSAAERKAIIDKAAADRKEAEDTFKTELEGLQATYKRLMQEKDDKINAIDSVRVGLYRSIKDSSSGHDEL